MKTTALIRNLLPALALAMATANAAVGVSFTGVDHYTDARLDGYGRGDATAGLVDPGGGHKTGRVQP